MPTEPAAIAETAACPFRRADEIRPNDAVRHGVYLCLRLPAGERRRLGGAAGEVEALAARHVLRDEFDPGPDHPPAAVAYLRRVDATPGDLPDDGLLDADAVVHVAAEREEPVRAFLAGLADLLGPAVATRTLVGVVRPTVYTGNAMHDFAYAHRLLQQPAAAMPNAFLFPTSKTAEWWEKGWMERHTYFLPRFDDAGHQVADGHALAAAGGIDCLMRRTYKSPTEPAAAGEYDFVNYFECADADLPRFHAVCAALRDTARNPEWRFVREGPLWHGRRVAGWAALTAMVAP